MHTHVYNTQQRCRFVLVNRPAYFRFPAVRRLTDKQAIALSQVCERFDLGLPDPKVAALSTNITNLSPDRRFFP